LQQAINDSDGILGLVIYIDMDYFFAACEELRHPELKGKPLIVGSAPEESRMRGVVQTCNYEARRFGIHSGMPSSDALKLKPDISYLPSDEAYYESMSSKILNVLMQYNMKIEQMSVDEFALDSGMYSYDIAERIAKEIKVSISSTTGLPCTVGVSIGKTFAKMACDQAKPNGLMVLEEKDLMQFLEDKDVGKLIGIGGKTKARLNAIDIKTIGDIRRANASKLVAEFGAMGAYMYALANGRDPERVKDPAEALSIGRERTLEHNTEDRRELLLEASKLAKVVVGELNQKGFLFKTVSIKAKYQDFTERIKSKTLRHYSNSLDMVSKSTEEMIDSVIVGKPIRKIGIRLSTFTKSKGQRKL
jgi:nucleotidyltransferase/DNA polymerase involved in DNA repair